MVVAVLVGVAVFVAVGVGVFVAVPAGVGVEVPTGKEENSLVDGPGHSQ